MNNRLAGIGMAVLMAVFVVVMLFWDPSPAPDRDTIPKEWYSPTYCASCHKTIVDEWTAGLHSQADSDPERDLIQIAAKFSVKDCNLCHAPRSTWENLGRTPAGRVDSEHWPIAQGVDCASCHLTPEGMASSNPAFQGDTRPDAATAPCRPIYKPAIATVEHCKSCHNQHKTVDQWSRTRYAKPGPEFQDCRHCHMPTAPGPGTTGGARTTHWSHTTPGSHTPAMLRRAILLAARIEGDTVIAELDTRGSAHNFPTDYRTRFGLFIVEAATDSGGWRTLHSEKWRQPFRSEPGGSTPGGNTQIAGDTVHTRRVALQGHGGTVRVRIFYSLRPYTDQEPGRFDDFTTDKVVGGRMFLVHEVKLR
ncbi:MAG: multiheme c-type cytochrome [Planctomycetota bacterium]